MPAEWIQLSMLKKAGARLHGVRQKWETPTITSNYVSSAATRFNVFAAHAYEYCGVLFTQSAAKISVHGNLRKEEYRQYSGHPNTLSTFSQCRVCLAVCNTKEARHNHNKLGCRWMLDMALKEETMRGLCIVCDASTNIRHWGVPLCNTECKQLYQFDVVRPDRLRKVLGKIQEDSDVTVLEQEDC